MSDEDETVNGLVAKGLTDDPLSRSGDDNDPAYQLLRFPSRPKARNVIYHGQKNTPAFYTSRPGSGFTSLSPEWIDQEDNISPDILRTATNLVDLWFREEADPSVSVQEDLVRRIARALAEERDRKIESDD
ncbi:hypothetical protein [Rhizobium sp. Root482]|uniref:hypothetical protein n=1 Tax=Rhizobium sp. Root482 TaxID=1736543 RepID=UPI0012E377C5|nr:hypothetical protein [Rhizobium sp. Root482]